MNTTDSKAGPPGRGYVALAGWLALCYAVAALGALATSNARAFYAGLAKPAWAPPGWLFGPVWSVLFTAMAFAAWLALRTAPGVARPRAQWLFVAQLAVNALWSWLFFGWQLGGWALAELLLMWALIAATLRAFWVLRRAAAWLMAPYLAWVTFAGVLNAVLWRMNPGILG